MHLTHQQEQHMLTLIVNGIPAMKLQKKSEIPSRRGAEAWRVIDESGKVVDSYSSRQESADATKRHPEWQDALVVH